MGRPSEITVIIMIIIIIIIIIIINLIIISLKKLFSQSSIYIIPFEFFVKKDT